MRTLKEILDYCYIARVSKPKASSGHTMQEGAHAKGEVKFAPADKRFLF